MQVLLCIGCWLSSPGSGQVKLGTHKSFNLQGVLADHNMLVDKLNSELIEVFDAGSTG
jgi:hypothetical protein